MLSIHRTDPAPDPASDLPTLDQLLPALFDELRAIAHRQLAREHGPITLQTTDLVHEAYLKLRGSGATDRDRAYFFAAASRAMRQVLVDAARRRNAAKRGSQMEHLSLGQADGAVAALGAELVDLDDALLRLEHRHPRLARVVECRFFGGMSVEDTAEVLSVSPRTVKADWAMARAWLYQELRELRTA